MGRDQDSERGIMAADGGDLDTMDFSAASGDLTFTLGSVTVTELQALRACRNAGITVPVETIQRAASSAWPSR